MSSDARFQDEPPPRPDEDAPLRRDEGEAPPSRLGELTADEKQWGLFAHLSGILLGFLGPLIVWMMKKEESRFLEDQGKEALNFQLNLLLHMIVLTVVSVATCGFGALLFLPWAAYIIVMPILGGLKANSGERYRYPATWRMIP